MYDPKPYIAVRVAGTQIMGARKVHSDKTGGTQRWKKLELTDSVSQPVGYITTISQVLDIGAGPNFRETQTAAPPLLLYRACLEEKT